MFLTYRATNMSLLHLPRELLGLILEHGPTASIGALAQVCKQLHARVEELVKYEVLWRVQYERDFSDNPATRLLEAEKFAYRYLYRYMYSYRKEFVRGREYFQRKYNEFLSYVTTFSQPLQFHLDYEELFSSRVQVHQSVTAAEQEEDETAMLIKEYPFCFIYGHPPFPHPDRYVEYLPYFRHGELPAPAIRSLNKPALVITIYVERYPFDNSVHVRADVSPFGSRMNTVMKEQAIQLMNMERLSLDAIDTLFQTALREWICLDLC